MRLLMPRKMKIGQLQMDMYRKMTGIGLMIVLCACQSAGSESLDSVSNSTTDRMNAQGSAYIEKEKTRLKQLLDQFPQTLEEEAVGIAMHDRGAVYSTAYTVKDKDVHAQVWLFETQTPHNATHAWLKETQEGGKFFATVASNGGWLMWVYADANDPQLQSTVRALIAAFAGEE
jgi:hypothetical protein